MENGENISLYIPARGERATVFAVPFHVFAPTARAGELEKGPGGKASVHHERLADLSMHECSLPGALKHGKILLEAWQSKCRRASGTQHSRTQQNTA